MLVATTFKIAPCSQRLDPSASSGYSIGWTATWPGPMYTTPRLLAAISILCSLKSLKLRVAPADRPLCDIQCAVLVGSEAVRAVEFARGERRWSNRLAGRILRVRPARTIADRLIGAEIPDQSVVSVHQRQPGAQLSDDQGVVIQEGEGAGATQEVFAEAALELTLGIEHLDAAAAATLHPLPPRRLFALGPQDLTRVETPL